MFIRNKSFIFTFIIFFSRETLMGIAKHFETGESLPEDVYLKLVAARTFRAGSLSLRQVFTIHWLHITFWSCIKNCAIKAEL